MKKRRIALFGPQQSGKSDIFFAILHGRPIGYTLRPSNDASNSTKNSGKKSYEFWDIPAAGRYTNSLPMYTSAASHLILVLSAADERCLANQAQTYINRIITQIKTTTSRRSSRPPNLLILINKVDGDEQAIREKKVKNESEALAQLIADTNAFSFNPEMNIHAISAQTDSQKIQTIVNQHLEMTTEIIKVARASNPAEITSSGSKATRAPLSTGTKVYIAGVTGVTAGVIAAWVYPALMVAAKQSLSTGNTVAIALIPSLLLVGIAVALIYAKVHNRKSRSTSESPNPSTVFGKPSGKDGLSSLGSNTKSDNVCSPSPKPTS